VVIRNRSIIALKGQNEIAQGNALGKWPIKPPALKGRKSSVADYLIIAPLQGLFYGGNGYPGLRFA